MRKEVLKDLEIIQSDRYYRILTTTQLNICTCGDCGCIIIVDTVADDLENIQCPFCHFVGEYCDFPDLYYV